MLKYQIFLLTSIINDVIVAERTKNLRTWKRGELLLPSKQVPVRERQLSVELLQLREPPPHRHLLHILWMNFRYKLQTPEKIVQSLLHAQKSFFRKELEFLIQSVAGKKRQIFFSKVKFLIRLIFKAYLSSTGGLVWSWGDHEKNHKLPPPWLNRTEEVHCASSLQKKTD